jgi:hypothetical protein
VLSSPTCEAIFAWRLANVAAEDLREVALVRETRIESDLNDAALGAPEQMTGAIDPRLVEQIRETATGAKLQEAREMGRREPHVGRNLVSGNGVGAALFDDVEGGR